MVLPLRLKKVLFGSTMVDTWTPVSGAGVHLDFVNLRNYWNGAKRQYSEFTTLTGVTFSNGLVTSGTAADRDISIAWSSLNLTLPLAMIVNYTPASVTGVQIAASLDLDASNYMTVGTNAASHRSFTVTATVTQIGQNSAGAAIGTRATHGVQLETNNGLQSINGSTAAAADTSVTLFTPSVLTISERLGNNNPFAGTIHHVVLASGSRTQAELNTLTAAVHAL
jgi:hypothetical protein